MRIIRYRKTGQTNPQLGVVLANGDLVDLPFASFLELVEKGKQAHLTPMELIKETIKGAEPLSEQLEDVTLTVPIEAPEFWAAGVTYERSREGRNYESTGGKSEELTFYDKVYEAERPEIFFKSTKDRTVGPKDDVYLRSDSSWQIPEPELGIVLDPTGKILGLTIGNDMSSRDIEGENPLYLPQAKIWRHSCAIGPAILLAESVEDPYNLEIQCRIFRENTLIFQDKASTKQLKRKLTELAECLVKDNVVFDGTVLLTGTCIVPPNDFTLQEGDRIEIEIPEIGILENQVKNQIQIL
jgi:2-dehydro-3-deoxy-D-arabinonate dehydratase